MMSLRKAQLSRLPVQPEPELVETPEEVKPLPETPAKKDKKTKQEKKDEI